MIRGVNRLTIEIGRTGSPYFERAICFVRPEFARCDKLDLHRAAQQMISSLDAGVEQASARSAGDAKPKSAPEARLPWASLILSALAGAVISLLICLLVR
ncbi:MAG: hypothetical protein IJP17_06915 [Clostridia bacterium]|nr:hypothetical protein [Clostridia bacterium]